tara:strand:+ start:581 stop:817 length:237 start_codon:yes stop_codon:yes gene_type:complete
MQYAIESSRKVLADALGLEKEWVPITASIETFEEWSSMGHIRLVHYIENMICRKLETEEILRIVDLDGIANVLSLEDF